MRRILATAALAAVMYSCGSNKALVSAKKAKVLTTIDLVDVFNDKVKVVVDPGAFTAEEVSFFIPKTVPGTYSSDDYGKYIEDFKALDYKGNTLEVQKVDVNTWKILNAKSLDKLSYFVNDTYDSEADYEEPVFSPSGTNIEAGDNFMLNLHGFVGYFDDVQETPYELIIKKPTKLHAATSLQRIGEGQPETAIDTFVASRYFEVIDNPIQYTSTKAESFKINDITVNISVYSPHGVVTPLSLKDKMMEMMKAQKTFLGDINSTKVYNILLYLSKMDGKDANGMGALEHHTSTVVVLPEALPKERLEQAMVDVVSHEFFHIVTPLNVHSKEIQFFDFNDPKMSEHLWMYEGTTEYFANLFQIQQGLISEEEFYKRLVDKISNAQTYDDAMSFTVMSKNILEEPYKDNYANVYEKGTLINMSLDIILKDLSKGQKSVLWLMKELSKKYDNDTPFNDDELFGEIEKLTYPEVKEFFATHVIGTTPIDYTTYLEKVGLEIKEDNEETGYFLKGDVPFIDVDPANDNEVFVRDGVTLNTFFTNLGLEAGDIFKEINGTAVTLETMRQVIGQSFGWSPEADVTIVVDRDGEEVTLTGKAGAPTVSVLKIVPMENASSEQLTLREQWLKG